MRYGERSNGYASLRLAVPRGLPREMRGPVVELRDLKTNPPSARRQGHARDLMEKVTAEADRDRFFLFLHVDPTGDMNAQDLLIFYGRLGFVPIQAEPLLMVRPFAGAIPRILTDGTI